MNSFTRIKENNDSRSASKYSVLQGVAFMHTASCVTAVARRPTYRRVPIVATLVTRLLSELAGFGGRYFRDLLAATKN